MRRLLLLLPLLCALPLHATTTISRVGSAAGTTSVTVPSHLPGDLFIAYTANKTNSTAITLPAGWNSLSAGAAGSTYQRISCKTAQSAAETATGFTNATGMILLIYRGTVVNSPNCDTLTVGGSLASQASSATISYGGITLTDTNNSSWVIGCGMSATGTDLVTAPTGMTNVTTANSGAVGCADTNAVTSTWSTQTTSVNQNAQWQSFTLEIRACTTGVCVRGLVIGSSGGSSSTVASPATVHTAGRKLIAFINNATTGTNVMGVANTAADTWALCSGSRENTVGHIEFWETTSVPNGNAADIVTATFTGNDTAKNIGIYEMTGLLTTACETAAVNAGVGQTTFTTATFSPAKAGNYNILGTFSNTGITATAGANYVLNCCTSNGLEHRFGAPSGAQTASITLSPSSNTGISLASFKATPGGGMQLGNFVTGP